MAYNYFNIREETGRIGGLSTFRFPKAVPTTTNGVIDVFNTLPWKLTHQNDEVPSIVLEEYELTYGRLTSSLLKLAQNVSGALTSKSLGDPYQILYSGKPTGFKYNLPYIVPGQIRGGISNTYGADTDSVTGKLTEWFPKISGFLSTVAEVGAGMSESGVQFGLEELQKFTGTQPRTINVNFVLYNTVDLETANNNYSFVSLLQFQNLKTRTSFMTQKPPCIYMVSSNAEGGVYMPAAYMSVNVEGLGTLRSISEFSSIAGSVSERLMPEAYSVKLSITELIPQSSNIMMGELGDKRVQVIGNIISTSNNINSATSSIPKVVPVGSPPPTNATPSSAATQFNSLFSRED